MQAVSWSAGRTTYQAALTDFLIARRKIKCMLNCSMHARDFILTYTYFFVQATVYTLVSGIVLLPSMISADKAPFAFTGSPCKLRGEESLCREVEKLEPIQ